VYEKQDELDGQPSKEERNFMFTYCKAVFWLGTIWCLCQAFSNSEFNFEFKGFVFDKKPAVRDMQPLVLRPPF
jgi:hypothetical protein